MENLPNLVTIYPKFSNKTIYNRVTQSSKLSIMSYFFHKPMNDDFLLQKSK